MVDRDGYGVSRLCHCHYKPRYMYTLEMDNSEIMESLKDVANKVLLEDSRDISISRLPVMVKSEFSWMSDMTECDCEFNYGGYFLVNEAEMVTRLNVLYKSH